MKTFLTTVWGIIVKMIVGATIIFIFYCVGSKLFNIWLLPLFNDLTGVMSNAFAFVACCAIIIGTGALLVTAWVDFFKQILKDYLK